MFTDFELCINQLVGISQAPSDVRSQLKAMKEASELKERMERGSIDGYDDWSYDQFQAVLYLAKRIITLAKAGLYDSYFTIASDYSDIFRDEE